MKRTGQGFVNTIENANRVLKKKRMTEEDLPTRIKYWLREANHDCFFVVGPENGPTERIGAMKTLLMGDSEPFRAMLQDSELAKGEDIKVTDIQPETFKNFLKCAYGGTALVLPKLSFEECAKLLYVTEKYLLHDITNEITEHLKKNFSFQDMFIAVSHPICYHVKGLKREILKWLKYEFKKITSDGKFLELSYTEIEWILQQNEINVREIDVWSATLQWAKHKMGSNDKNVLRIYIFDLLKYIRFLTMDYAEFWKNVVSSEILLEEEVFDICKSLVSGKQCSFQHLCSNTQSRCNMFQVSKNIISSIMVTPKFALLRCSVSCVSDLMYDTYCSETHHWAGHLWSFSLEKRVSYGKDTISVYINCEGRRLSWNVTVDLQIRLVNQTGKRDVQMKDTITFSPSVPDWGFPSFYSWSALLNPDKGFVKNNTIVFLSKITLKNM